MGRGQCQHWHRGLVGGRGGYVDTWWVGSDGGYLCTQTRAFYTFRGGVAQWSMKSNLASMRLSPTVHCLYVLHHLLFFRSPRVIKPWQVNGRCHSHEVRVYSCEFIGILLFGDCSFVRHPPWCSKPLSNRHRSPSLPGTRLEITSQFHIHTHVIAG